MPGPHARAHDGHLAHYLAGGDNADNMKLINLVGNAIKFTETGGVRLVARLVQRTTRPLCLQFDVIDTGIGMTPEETSKLFQPFAAAV